MTLNDDEIRRIPINEGVRLDRLTEVFGHLTPRENILVKPSEETPEGRIIRQEYEASGFSNSVKPGEISGNDTPAYLISGSVSIDIAKKYEPGD